MKKLYLLSIILVFISIGCNDQSREAELPKTVHLDNSGLEEAKAITKKILEVMDETEGERFSQEQVKKIGALQKQLNMLIISLEEPEVKELDSFKNELLFESAGKIENYEK